MSNIAVTNGIDESGNAQYASSFTTNGIFIKNAHGESVDFSSLVTRLYIYESIDSPFLVLELMVKDSINFLEQFSLQGQETIEVNLNVKKFNGEKNLKIQFFVTEYPDYSRSMESHTQAYKIIGVTQHAYVSPLKVISRSFSNNTVDEMSRIFKNDLNVSNVVINGDCVSNVEGIIPIQSPLSAVEWLRKMSFDSNRSPFTCFQNLTGNVNIASLSNLIGADSYNTYTFKTFSSTTPLSDQNFVEQATTILNVDSQLNLSKSYQLQDGAFASQNRYFDVNRKEFTEKTYSYDEFGAGRNSLNGNELPRSRISTKRSSEKPSLLSELSSASIHHTPIIGNSFSSDQSVVRVQQENEHFSRSWESVFNTVSHTLTLNGDFVFSPGRVITLSFPKSVDYDLYNELTNNESHDFEDSSMSGRYIVFSVVHRFENGEYKMNANVRKDSV